MIRNSSLIVLSLTLSIFSAPDLFAGRLIKTPSIDWFDYWEVTAKPLVNNTYSRCVTLSLTNISPTPTSQTVEIKAYVDTPPYAGPAAGATTQVAVFSPEFLPVQPVHGGNPSAPASCSPANTSCVPSSAVYTIPQNETKYAGSCIRYLVTAQGPNSTGAVAFAGSLRLEINVTESDGAMVALINTNYWNMLKAVDDKNIHSAIQNVGKTFEVNGGRPF